MGFLAAAKTVRFSGEQREATGQPASAPFRCLFEADRGFGVVPERAARTRAAAAARARDVEQEQASVVECQVDAGSSLALARGS